MTRGTSATSSGASGLFLAGGFVLLWNSGFIGAEYGLPWAGPFTLLFWRYLALSVLLLPVVLVRRKAVRPRKGAIAQIGLVGILAHAVWLGCVLVALDRDVPAGIVALVVSLQPILTGVLSGWVTGERTLPRQWTGLLVGFVGVAVAVGARLQLEGEAGLFGYLLPFGSALAMTAASLIQRRGSLRTARSGDSTSAVGLLDQLLIQSVASALVLLPLALGLESMETTWTMPFVGTLAWLILAVSLGAYLLMWVLLNRLEATQVASLFYLGPPVTMLMAWVAFGDTLRWTDAVGLVITAVGVVLVTRR